MNTPQKILIRYLTRTHQNPAEGYRDAVAAYPQYAEEFRKIAQALKIKL